MNIETHVHREGHATERMAASKADLSAQPIKRHILALLAEEPGGITPDEYCLEFGGLINTVRRRFTDLWKEGKIRHHPGGLTRVNVSGNECVVWVLGEDGGASLPGLRRWRGRSRGCAACCGRTVSIRTRATCLRAVSRGACWRGYNCDRQQRGGMASLPRG